MKLKRKILSLVMTAAMITTLFAGVTISASAYTATGTMSSLKTTTGFNTATTNGVYSISNATELGYFRDYVNGGYATSGRIFYLTGDITLSGTWTPIGNATITSSSSTNYSPVASGTGFAGTFDGQNFKVSGLSITSGGNGAGLFKYVTSTGIVKKLVVEGSVSASNGDAIAGVVGYNSGTIEQVINKATVTGTGCYNVGGVTGFNNGYYGTHTGIITNCGNEGSVSAGAKIGGIAGENAGSISGCYNYATIKNLGGNRGTGGIVGRNGNNNTPAEIGTITNCYNRGYVNNNNVYWGGGIAGFQSAGCTITKCYDTGDVYNCSWSNPIVGKNEGTFSYCYYKNGLNHSGSGTSELGIGMDLEDMQIQDFADTLNGSNDFWSYASCLNNGLPYLKWQGTTFSDSAATDGISGSSPSASWGNNSGTIVLNGRFASDGVTSGTKTGYKTLSAALTAAGSTGTIYVTGPVSVTNSVSISSNVTIIRDSVFTDGYLFEIGNGGSITMSNGTINGGGLYANAQVLVMSGGTFTMSGGTITNAYGKYRPGAGVRVDGGTFNLSGGTLTGLTGTGTNTYGAAVTVTSGTFNMTGGTVSGNTVTSGLGVIYVGANTTFSYAGSGIASGQVVYLNNTSGNSDAYITLTGMPSPNIKVQCANPVSNSTVVAIANVDAKSSFEYVNNSYSFNSEYISGEGYEIWIV